MNEGRPESGRPSSFLVLLPLCYRYGLGVACGVHVTSAESTLPVSR